MDISKEPHRRLNLLTGEWVLVSPQRAMRPWQGHVETGKSENRPGYDPQCYLCPGNTRAGGAVNPDYKSSWSFENDFPALHQQSSAARFEQGLLIAEAEPGICRVLCYSPDHSLSMAGLSQTQLLDVIALWQQEYLSLSAQPNIEYIQIFENKGEMMGCSNPHPHGQIWSHRSIPDLVRRKDQQQLLYHQEHEGASLLATYLRQEIEETTRIIWEDEDFVALVPWWAVWPFEVLLAPKRTQAHIGLLTSKESYAFAKALSDITKRYDRLFAVAFPYSAGIHQAPSARKQYSHWHWHVEFKPPLLRSAAVRKFMVGYEMFGMPQRDMSPEAAADCLRNC